MNRNTQTAGFTLVEVVMALAITTTSILVLLAMLPSTADSIANSHQTGRALSYGELAIADLRAAEPVPDEEDKLASPLLGIVLPQAGEAVMRTVYFDFDGVPSEADEAEFRVSIDLKRQGSDPNVMTMDCEVRWPADEDAVRAGTVNLWGIRTL